LHERVTVQTVNEDDGEDEDAILNPKKFVWSDVGDAGNDVYQSPNKAPFFTSEQLHERTVLLQEEDKRVLRYEVVKMIKDRDAANHQQITFPMAIGDGTLEELISYNELSDLCKR
jgi:predicted Abi (CAAX) family protease